MKTPPNRPRRGRGRSARLVVVLATIWLCACGVGSSRAPAPSDFPTVRVATSGDYAPFSIWPPEAAAPQGFSPELIERWARATGRRIEWVRFTWPELIDDARAGRFDLAIGGITVRPDRSIVGTFGVPLARTSAVVLVKTPTISLDDLDSPDRTIAVNLGGHLERVARERFPNAVLLTTTPNEAVPGRLERGEADAVVTDTRESPVWRRDHPRWLQLGPLTLDRKAAFAAPGRAELLAELDTWLETRRGRRTLLDLQAKRLGIDPVDAHATVVAALVAAVDERLALMPDVGRYKRAHGLPVDVPERESYVLDAAWRAVVAEAARRDTEPPEEAKVRAFYRAQMEAAKSIQRKVAAKGDGSPPRYDLERELRPALIRIGDRMARLLVTLRDDPPHGIEIHEWSALEQLGVGQAEIDAIREALAALAPKPANRVRAGSIF